MTTFDLLNIPLRGANLLEASAGTGKTYNIECLFLRFIIEKALPVGEILVVTYTVAATEELRDRIRRRLSDAAYAFSRGESGDSFLQTLLKKFPDVQERRLFQERLKAALRDFDEAAIYTIHGFCQRMLQENAFESNSLFDTELITNEQALREEIAADFWRTHFYENIPELAGYALSRRFGPRYFCNLLDGVISRSDVRILPDVGPSPLGAIKEHVAAYNGAFAAVLEAWPAVREEIYGKLMSPALHAGVYGRKTDRLMEAMDALVASGGPFFPLFEDFEKFTAVRIAASVKKKYEAPEHDFFQLCQTIKERADALTAEMEACLLFLKGELARNVRKELAVRKARNNVMFYDDLLIRTREALEGRGGEDLRRVIREKYKAALIDEFQDTDPVQYAIFENVFGRGDNPLPFFLIGDPKQAIYSFRGADIFAYMKAAAGMEGRHTIGENWRSEPGLVKAVSTLFSWKKDQPPFIFKEISFPSVKAAERVYESFTLHGRRESPLQWWFVPAEKYGEGGRPLSLDKAKKIIVRALAAEIARLLHAARQGEALIGTRRLREADIAVLVRTNREARLVQEGLRRLKIPSVLYNAGNIFETAEAEELERIMAAVSAPEEESLIRAALVTDILGITVEELEGLITDEEEWAKRAERFYRWRDLWFGGEFIGMFTAFMAGEDVRSRLLALPDGERRLTNLLHLGEALQRASGERKLGPRGLLRWLAQQRNETEHGLEEHQLRLESDEQAVKIVTVHKSKGLEYPVVFCPFAWTGSKIEEEVFSFHDDQNDGRITCHLGSPDDGPCRAKAACELLAENVRLLYVALTRAKHRCYFIWGRFNKAGTSAPAYLFHGGEERNDAGDDLVAAVEADFKKLSDADLYRQMEAISRKAEGEIALLEIPDPAGEESLPRDAEDAELTFREFSGRIDRSWRIVSFTSLLSERRHDGEMPDYDGDIAGGAKSRLDSPLAFVPAGDASFPEVEECCDIFSFPRGAGAGTLLHDILEHFDFTERSREACSMLVSDKLRVHGFDSRWENVILALLRKVVETPLYPFDGAGFILDPFTLAAISGRDRLNEVEFYFPLRRLAPEDLRSIFPRHCRSSLLPSGEAGPGVFPDFPLTAEGLHFNPARGFMKGFMDMVFRFGGRYYLVDWKSNFLGGHIKDYGQTALSRVMAENFYTLQYHIYVLALHQYLALRLPGYRYEEHMGGVYYIFLRGLDPASGADSGIYRARPEEGLIAEMAEKLIAC